MLSRKHVRMNVVQLWLLSQIFLLRGESKEASWSKQKKIMERSWSKPEFCSAGKHLGSWLYRFWSCSARDSVWTLLPCAGLGDLTSVCCAWFVLSLPGGNWLCIQVFWFGRLSVIWTQWVLVKTSWSVLWLRSRWKMLAMIISFCGSLLHSLRWTSRKFCVDEL